MNRSSPSIPSSLHKPEVLATDGPRCDPALAEARAALAAGRLVVMPTDTVYGLTGLFAALGVADRLLAARTALAPRNGAAHPSSATPRAICWHAGSVREVEQALDLAWPIHRRLVRRLLPGPAAFFAELNDDALVRAREHLGVAPHVIDDGRAVLLRVPDHPLALALAQSAPGLAAEQIPTPAGPARDAAAAAAALEAAGIDTALVLDAGRSPLGRPSTLIRMAADGSWRIEREGAMSRAEIDRRLRRTVLFVCTGNTCRSPMAQAIANHLLSRPPIAGPGEIPTIAASAGLGAGDGAPTTSETAAAIEAMGIPPRFSRSRALTRSMLDDADAIFVMTRGHLAGVRALLPHSDAAKVRLLDPEDRDIPDPLGSDQARYSSLAASMHGMIQRRLAELPE